MAFLANYKIPTALRLIIFAFFIIFALLFFFDSATILEPYMEGDYCVFYSIGKGWTLGAVPYVDMFDHKGPVLFFIQMIALSMQIGKAGIFILEIIWLIVVFELLFRCGIALRLSERNNYFVMFISYIILLLYGAGNTVEEWSLPFELIVLLMAIKILNGSNTSLRYIKGAAAVAGFCFATVALIRIDNNYIICGLALGLIVSFIKNKEYGCLWASILFFFIGLVLGFLPWIIYFASKNALGEMLYATFIFNLKYKANLGVANVGICYQNVVKLMPCLILPWIAFVYDKRNHTGYFLSFLFVSALCFCVFVAGFSFKHYFLMTLPITALCIQLSCGFKWKTRTAIVVYILGPLFIGFHYLAADYYNNIKVCLAYPGEYDNITPIKRLICHTIPEEDLDSVYTCIDSSITVALVETGHIPVGKYVLFQDWHCQVGADVYNQIREKFDESRPKWVITTSNLDFSTFDLLKEKANIYEEVPKPIMPDVAPESVQYFKIYRRID